MSNIVNGTRVLVSAAASPAAVSLLRHLRQLGYIVRGMDSNAQAVPLAELCCDEFVLAPLAKTSQYLPFLRQQLNQVDLFLPFVDEEIQAILEAPDFVDLAEKTMLSPPDTLRTCLDKACFQTFCQQHQLSIAPLAVGVPAIYKPFSGRGGKGVMRVDDPALFQLLQRRTEGLLQRYLDGIEYTVDCLFDRSGKKIFAVARQRQLAAGVSTIGQIDQQPAVLALVDQLAGQCDFRGLVNIQIMLVEDQPYLIEVNPRLSGSLIFTILAGADLLKAALSLWLSNQYPEPLSVREGRVLRYWSEHYVCD